MSDEDIHALAQHVLRLLFEEIDIDHLEVLVDALAGDRHRLVLSFLFHLGARESGERQRGRGESCAAKLQYFSAR
jgi:hypothetical protein